MGCAMRVYILNQIWVDVTDVYKEKENEMFQFPTTHSSISQKSFTIFYKHLIISLYICLSKIAMSSL